MTDEADPRPRGAEPAAGEVPTDDPAGEGAPVRAVVTVGGMAVPQARTISEAYMYLELTLPPGEGWVDYERHSTLRRDGGAFLLRFDGPYEGRHCVAEVSVPVASQRESDRAELRYGPGRSRLIDPGQWYLIESGYVGMARTGLAQLAGAVPDEDTYWAIVGAWDAADAAAGEIEKFLPPDAEVLPPEASWTEQGRRAHEDHEDAFRRTRLETARTRYRRERDEWTARYGNSPTAVPPEPTGSERSMGSGQAGPGDSDPEPTELPARSYGEAYLYMDLHPCADCGSVLFPRGNMEVLASDDERGLVVSYDGPCEGCGRRRRFRFRLPHRPGVPPESPHLVSWPGDGPSELLDAADWLAVATAYSLAADELSAMSGSLDADREEMFRLLAVSATAVDEALRFLPAGADALAPSTVWTDTGREEYARDPRRFHRDRLTAEREERHRRLDEFLARYPDVGSTR